MTGRVTCVDCSKNKVRRKGKQRDGITPRYDTRCNGCHKKKYRALYEANRSKSAKKIKPRQRYLKGHCEKCLFVPEHLIQLQLDHIDGNRANNHPSNFQTLCANCHVLKTWNNKDFLTPSRQPKPYRFNGEQWVTVTA